jgi:hypothetical protein
MKNGREKMKTKPFIISRAKPKLNESLSYVYLRTPYGAILHYSETEKPSLIVEETRSLIVEDSATDPIGEARAKKAA